ncbi:protein of unknown function (plasmid) [Streptantibioticus cattleyicolor NRRL 8057 = DSM 46488]|nr:protein of unknown function [Streptantibioticus cattleyicolor NRRL 8057 = DSM 46488]
MAACRPMPGPSGDRDRACPGCTPGRWSPRSRHLHPLDYREHSYTIFLLTRALPLTLRPTRRTPR